MARKHSLADLRELLEQRPEHVDAKSRRQLRRRRVSGPWARPENRDEHMPSPQPDDVPSPERQPLGDNS
jgi:hypothetical protein